MQGEGREGVRKEGGDLSRDGSTKRGKPTTFIASATINCLPVLQPWPHGQPRQGLSDSDMCPESKPDRQGRFVFRASTESKHWQTSIQNADVIQKQREEIGALIESAFLYLTNHLAVFGDSSDVGMLICRISSRIRSLGHAPDTLSAKASL